jgi:hypothetical protein
VRAVQDGQVTNAPSLPVQVWARCVLVMVCVSPSRAAASANQDGQVWGLFLLTLKTLYVYTVCPNINIELFPATV